MSEHLARIGTLDVAEFAGGQDRGRCLQLTPDGAYAQLTATDVARLARELLVWLAESRFVDRVLVDEAIITIESQLDI